MFSPFIKLFSFGHSAMVETSRTHLPLHQDLLQQLQAELSLSCNTLNYVTCVHTLKQTLQGKINNQAISNLKHSHSSHGQHASSGNNCFKGTPHICSLYCQLKQLLPSPVSQLPGLGHHNSFRDHNINQVRKDGYLEEEKNLYFARLLFRHFVSLVSPTVITPEQSH